MSSGVGDIRITNCHVHTFTRAHTPTRFIPIPLNYIVLGLASLPFMRRVLRAITSRVDPRRAGAFTRYVEIVCTSYEGGQRQIFETVKNFYPDGTRFVVLPMDMTLMGAGAVKEGIREQHEQLARVRDGTGDLVIAFAAVDPRHLDTKVAGERFDVVAETKHLIAKRGFGGIKLYPPMGYHPADNRLDDLYSFADEYRVPVLSHCSRPAAPNKYHGHVTAEMRKSPLGGALSGSDYHVLMTFTDPDAYRPILDVHKRLQLCLAHFGGQGDWSRFINRPGPGAPVREPIPLWQRPLVWLRIRDQPPFEDESWLTKVLQMIREYDNLWTDISYTLFADDDFVYLLKVLLQERRIRSRVLFGSDFYVVQNARLEERSRSVRIRAILGEELYREIAEENPRSFLNVNRSKLESDLQSGRLVV